MHKFNVSIVGLAALLLFGADAVCAQQICPLPGSIKPKGVSSLETFKSIAIEGERRVLPLDSFARNVLTRFSGENSIDGKSAIGWFAKLIFAPETTRTDKVFRITDPHVAGMLGIASGSGVLYSYADLEPHLSTLETLAKTARDTKAHDRNAAADGVIALYANVALYADLANSFAFAVPHPDFQVDNDEVVRALNLPDGKNIYSFFDIASRADALMTATKGLDQRPVDQRTPREKELSRLLGNLFNWSMYYQNNAFRVIPPSDPTGGTLLSPWEAINTEFKHKEVREEINQLRNWVVNYWNGEQMQFDMAVKLFKDSAAGRTGSKESNNTRAVKFGMEIFNNWFQPLWWAGLFYGLALFSGILFFVFKRVFLGGVAIALMTTGFFAHLWALVSSAWIAAQPPVTNTRAVFSLLGLAGVFLGVVWVAWKRKPSAVVPFSALAFGLLIMAGQFP